MRHRESLEGCVEGVIRTCPLSTKFSPCVNPSSEFGLPGAAFRIKLLGFCQRTPYGFNDRNETCPSTERAQVAVSQNKMIVLGDEVNDHRELELLS